MEELDLQLHMLARAGIAALLGGLIGLEREIKGRPAGLRTHLLIAAAAALFIPLGISMIDNFETEEGPGTIRADPLRVIEAVITGISFIGAGTIVFRKGQDRIEGITTATSILFTAATGIAVGLGHYVVGVGSAVGVILVLLVLGRIEERFLGADRDAAGAE